MLKCIILYLQVWKMCASLCPTALCEYIVTDTIKHNLIYYVPKYIILHLYVVKIYVAESSPHCISVWVSVWAHVNKRKIQWCYYMSHHVEYNDTVTCDASTCRITSTCTLTSIGVRCWVYTTMGWLRIVGSLKLKVSFAEYRLFCRALLKKRPIFLRSLLMVATP